MGASRARVVLTDAYRLTFGSHPTSPRTYRTWSRPLAFLKFLRHSRLNDLSIRQHHGEKQVLGWPTSRICKANEPMRKRLFIKFRILKTARLQVVKRCHPIRRDPGGLLSGNGVGRGLRTRFKHVLKFPTVLCRERVAEQFSRIRENRHQKTAKNWGDEREAHLVYQPQMRRAVSWSHLLCNPAPVPSVRRHV